MIVTLEEVKAWLRVDYDDGTDAADMEDALIIDLIGAAEEYLYNSTGHVFKSENRQAKLLCRILIMDWYENREMNNFRVGEKVRFTVESMTAQLSHCY